MKKLILLLTLICLVSVLKAQTTPPAQKEQPVYIRILPTQLNVLQQILQFSYANLPTSKAPSADVQTVLPAIKEIYPVLVPDTTILVTQKPVKAAVPTKKQ